jgi:hypothetical protein
MRWSFASKGPSSKSSLLASQAAVVAQVTLAAASPGKKQYSMCGSNCAHLRWLLILTQ